MKKQPVSDYRQVMGHLSKSDNEKLNGYFARLSQRVQLPRNQRQAFIRDFENAFLYYAKSGVSLDEAIKRLDAVNLGGFYIRPPVLWYPLDDAAKIYPLSMKRNQMAIFRLSVYLKEEIVPELLQIALTFTIKRFPTFATTVKNGFFWHYLDTSKRRYIAEPETEIPCHPLKVSASGSQSFRMVYFKHRISVEFFHVLTDGSGALVFLKTLTAEYLRLRGLEIPYTGDVLDINEPPIAGETSNHFRRAEHAEKGAGFLDKPAVQLSGRLSRKKPCQILHFELDCSRLKEAAKHKNASVTAYILALLFAAGRHATDALCGDMQIQVPVNMRNHYPSKTFRNFSLYCNIKIALPDITGAEAILPEISRQLKEKTSKEAMDEMMNATAGLVRLLRYIPLFIKRPFAQIVYGFLGEQVFSNTLSNLGVVTVPDAMAPYIDKLDFVLGSGMTNRVSCSMITYGETATLSLAKRTADPTFEEKLAGLFTESGLLKSLKGSDLYGN